MGGSPWSDLAAFAQVLQHDVDALLVDDTHARVGDAQPDPALLAFHPETTVLQVGVETALGLVVGVGHVVPDLRLFARYLADTCHGMLRVRKRGRIIGGTGGPFKPRFPAGRGIWGP